jgi:HEAT repeat protein
VKRTVLLVACLPLLDCQAARAQIDKWEIAPGFGLPVVTKTPEELAKQLESKDVKARRDAAIALYFLKWNAKPAIPALTKAMKDPDHEVRGMAAGCFRFLGPPIAHPDDAVPILADLLLKDPNLSVRRVSALSLRQLTWLDKGLTKGVAPALLEVLSEKDKWIRLNAAGALAILGKGGDKPFQALEEFLGDEDKVIHEEIICAMGEIGLPALPTLKRCLQHKSAKVRRTAGSCFAEMIAEVRRKKQDLPQEVVAPLAKALGDSDAGVVDRAIRALSEIGPPAKEAIPEIIKCLKHRDAEVRSSAAVHLSETRTLFMQLRRGATESPPEAVLARSCPT